jgi:hypothetical protein
MKRPEAEADRTGLPWLRTWRGVYRAVFVSLIVWIGLLTALTRWFR